MLARPQFTRTGLILYVPDYPACVRFYRDVLGWPVLFDTPGLTCFDLGSSYLMVEPAGASQAPAAADAPGACLRLNVPDVQAQALRLRELGVAVDYQEHSWGTIASFCDPAGNRCEYKDDLRFEQQVRAHTGA